MKPDKSAVNARSEKSASRIWETLRADIRKSKLQVQEVSVLISRSPSHLYKVFKGTLGLSLDQLLQILDIIDVEPGSFFARTFGSDNSPTTLLTAVERLGTVHARLERFEKTLRSLESAPIRPEPPRATDVDKLLAKLVTCTGIEQRRRLSTAERYRDPALVQRYLEHLDALRYDQPKQAALNAETVAVKLLPHLRGPHETRLTLAVQALVIYGSAHRQMGGFATAARAIRVALETVQRNHLAELKVDLLQRGAYVLSDHGRFVEAMKLLDEALVMVFDLDLDERLGMIFVDRGLMLNFVGSYLASARALRKALTLLKGDSHQVRRNRLAAYELLGANHRELGNLKQADRVLALALEEFRDSGQLNLAKLLWQQGAVALELEAWAVAEERFQEALRIFQRTNGSERALVTLDLAKALHMQGKGNEIAPIAIKMVDYLKSFRGNRVASAAISGFSQMALSGSIALDQIEEVAQILLECTPHPLLRTPSGMS